MRFFFTALAVCLLLSACTDKNDGDVRRKYGVYLWREAYSPEVSESVGKAAGDFDCLNFLAAKISFLGEPKKPAIKIMAVDTQTLAQSGMRLAASVRIGGVLGDSKTYAALGVEISDMLCGALENLKAKGLKICELQVDFDCPESKIGDYAVWMRMFRENLDSSVKLSFTALPSQMNARGFSKLAVEADSFTLQIHHFSRRKDDYSIFNKKESVAAVRKAERFGRPFNVAVPTYSHVAVFERQNGGFVRAYSENFPGLVNPEKEKALFVRSDPSDVAELIEYLDKLNLSNYKGVIFYRLPCGNELTNWSVQTLLDVRRGAKPRPELSMEIREVRSPLYEVYIVNKGGAPSYSPFSFDVKGEFASFGAINGFSARRSEVGIEFEADEWSLVKVDSEAALKIGWAIKKQ